MHEIIDSSTIANGVEGDRRSAATILSVMAEIYAEAQRAEHASPRSARVRKPFPRNVPLGERALTLETTNWNLSGRFERRKKLTLSKAT